MTAPRDRKAFGNELGFLALVFSIALAASQVEVNIIRGKDVYGSQSWPTYWLVLAGAGSFGAAWVYYLGGFWYKLRLRLSGIRGPDVLLVRRVYLSAAQVVAVPVLLKTLVYTFVHDTPQAAALADATWQERFYLVIPVWSAVVGYIGVRTVFQAPKVRAAIWFLVLPGLFYVAAAVLAFAGVSSGLLAAVGPASDVDHPNEFSSGTMAFAYPGNWSLMKGDAEYDPESDVQVRPVQDARVRLLLFKSEVGSEAAADTMAAAMQENLKVAADILTFDEWGGLKGVGRRFEARIKARTVAVRIFVTPLAEDCHLCVTEIYDLSAQDKVLPGFELVRKTFRSLRQVDSPAPDGV